MSGNYPVEYICPPQCIALIKGFEHCRLEPYMDIAGIPTIAWGHRIMPEENYTAITQAQADTLLMQDVASTARLVKRLTEKVQLNENQYSALISFAYNIGATAFSSSTLLKRVNARDFVGAAAQFAVWNKATVAGKRKVVEGLVRRRKAEAALFTSPMEVAGQTQTGTPPTAVTTTEPQNA